MAGTDDILQEALEAIQDNDFNQRVREGSNEFEMFDVDQLKQLDELQQIIKTREARANGGIFSQIR